MRGEWDPAIACFEKALSDVTYKTPYFAHNNLGLAYYNKGEYQKAIKNYQQALSLFPSYSLGYFNLALAYEAIERWEAAINAYETVISYYPEYPPAHLNVGKLYLKLGINEKAAKELGVAMEVDPKGPYGKEAKELLEKHQLPTWSLR